MCGKKWSQFKEILSTKFSLQIIQGILNPRKCFLVSHFYNYAISNITLQSCLYFHILYYSVFHRFRQAKFKYGGSILSLNKFFCHPTCLRKELASKVVKVQDLNPLNLLQPKTFCVKKKPAKVIITLFFIVLRNTIFLNTILRTYSLYSLFRRFRLSMENFS